MESTRFTRRSFIKLTTEATGGLLVSMSLPSLAAANTSGSDFTPNAWLRISPDGTTHFSLSKAEMGQGVMTSLAMLIAEELDVDLASLKVEFAPVSPEYKDPEFGLQMTGGSSSVRTSYEPLRRAGAVTRDILISAAAKKWQVPKAQCYTEKGVIFDRKSSSSLKYSDLASIAANIPIPENVAIKGKSQFKIIGTNPRRLDNQDKISGKAVFGVDIEREDCLVAVVIRNSFGRKIASFDSKAATKLPGVVAVFEISTGVAVVADHYWNAQKASQAISIDWKVSKDIPSETAGIFKHFEKDFSESGHSFLYRGNIEKASEANKDSSGTFLQAEYKIPYMAHATMEPGNATAHVQRDRCDVWAPTQAPELAHVLATEVTGLPREKVHIHTTFLGGGFGRRLAQDYVIEAVEISKKLGKPVRMQMSREDDIKHDIYRPGGLHRLEASISHSGILETWQHKIVGPSILAQVAPQWAGAMLPEWAPQFVKKLARWGIETFYDISDNDPTSVEGTHEDNYSIAHQKVDYVLSDPGVPIGFWRSVGHSYTGFVVESFIDEVAHKLKQDPYSYRRDLLKSQPRRLNVLDLAAKKASWGKNKDIYQGIAQTLAFGSYTAQVVDVKVIDGEVKVTRVVCAIDCGSVIHPDNVIAQIEGSIIFALSAALKDAITFKDGQVEQSNFHDYRLLRSNETPEIDVILVDSNEDPQGVGEPGVPPLAPALANALFAATGRRQRELPLKFN